MVDLILKETEAEPTDYQERRTLKAVVVDERGRTLTFGPYLLGGGVEEGESDEQAIAREMLEEAGIEVEISKPLGRVIGYRDAIKRKYIVDGFLCRYLRKVCEPTTTADDEIGRESVWHNTIKDAVKYIESEIEKVKASDRALYKGDGYQSSLYNKLTALAFLNEAQEQGKKGRWPKRIIIIGDAGRGKTTLAEKLSEKLAIPYHSTDDYFFETKFTKIRERDAALEGINRLYEEPKWIVEGTTAWLLEPGIDRADRIIYLKHKNILLQWLILFKRYIQNKEDTFGNTLYLMRHVFYKRYGLGYKRGHVTHGEFLAPFQGKTVTLYSFKDIENFLKEEPK